VARALFFGLPVHGHTNPTLSLVRELVARGEEVTYLSTPAFATAIAATGATFRPYRNAFLVDLGAIARRMDELAWLLMRTTSEVLAEQLDDFRALRPDYVITDSVAPWGQWVGQLLAVPVVTSVTTFAFNKHVLRYGMDHGVKPRNSRVLLSKIRHIARALWLRRRLQRRHRVDGPSVMATIAGHSDLTIVYTSRALQPCGETFDSRYRFVGPILGHREERQDFPWDMLDEAPLVYVSLGTLFSANPAFYRACFAAFADLDAQVVLSIGRSLSAADLGAPPANVRVFSQVPQLDLLPRCRVFVTHGGMNSASESLWFGVPMVVVPQMGEQEIVGRRVEELGAAIVIRPEEADAGALRAAVVDLLGSDTHRTRAQAIGTELRNAGGASAAADAVLAFTRPKAEVRPGSRPTP